MTLTGLDDLMRFADIGLSLALGLLIGMQRGWALRSAPEGTRFAGIRTFGLLGLAGGIAGYLHASAGELATVVLAATAGLILIGYYRSSQREGAISGTASLVGLLTMACGFVAATGQELLATAVAVVMVMVLALRNQLHGWIGRLNETEVIAIARFALIALVILPLLPDRAYGPLDAWNPHQLWMVVVLVSGFSFLGYIASRKLGASRGTIATAAAGSVVSSTAVTASLANQLRMGAENPAIHHAGIAAASVVMFLRVQVLVFMLAPFALPTLARLAVPGMLVSLAGTALLLAKARQQGETPQGNEMPLRNPFDIGPALLMMALVMVMTLAARWVLGRYGDAGLATVLALSGSVDVDSAIITLGNLPAGTLDAKIAGLVLLPPILINTLFKAAAAASIAGWRQTWPAGAVLLASIAASLAALPFVL